jgi:hypothetical protein
MESKPQIKMEPIQTTSIVHQAFIEQAIKDEVKKGEPGKDFCQVCGAKTKFIDSGDFDIDAFECVACKAVHNIQNTYQKGVIISSKLVSIL